MGFGSRVSALSLVSYWISDSTKATLYASITVLESLGHAVGDPPMQHIFAAAVQLAPFWQAMPFFVASVSFRPRRRATNVHGTDLRSAFMDWQLCRRCLSRWKVNRKFISQHNRDNLLPKKYTRKMATCGHPISALIMRI